MKKYNHGFIQIPILIAIIIGTIVIGGTGYVGIEKYIENKIENKISELSRGENVT